jgi:Domain of unknown function (DUF4126)
MYRRLGVVSLGPRVYRNMLLDLRIPLIPTGTELTAVLVVVCFSAGLNVYATVAMLGLLSRAKLLMLPGTLHGVENWYVISVCCLLFLVEVVGDKVPVFDLLWNAAHTFVRIPVAALLAYGATSGLPPDKQLLATVFGALIAFLAHGGKVAARVAVTPSPEPLSNMALSLGEDASVIFLTWFATRHPFAAASIVLVVLAIIVVAIRAVIRALRKLLSDAEHILA